MEEPYDNLGLLVGDRPSIFVEAQATWSIDVLIHILPDIAQTYIELIVAMGWNVCVTGPPPGPLAPDVI